MNNRYPDIKEWTNDTLIDVFEHHVHGPYEDATAEVVNELRRRLQRDMKRAEDEADV